MSEFGMWDHDIGNCRGRCGTYLGSPPLDQAPNLPQNGGHAKPDGAHIPRAPDIYIIPTILVEPIRDINMQDLPWSVWSHRVLG